MKQNENTINDIAEKLEIVSNTKMVTKEELLQKIVDKDVIKNKMINVAGQMFIEYEEKLDNSDKMFKGYEVYIGDNKIRNDILDKVGGDNVKEVCPEKNEIFKNSSINRFNKILTNIKREMLSSK